MNKGIDVSTYQGKIDWNKVKKAGIEYAIIRAGFGKYAKQKDNYFDANVKGAKAAGIKIGAYWFGYATDVESAKEEADVFAEVIKGIDLELPVFYDYEYDSFEYAKKQGITVDKKKMSVADIKNFGEYTAEIKLLAGVTATITVKVTE